MIRLAFWIAVWLLVLPIAFSLAIYALAAMIGRLQDVPRRQSNQRRPLSPETHRQLRQLLVIAVAAVALYQVLGALGLQQYSPLLLVFAFLALFGCAIRDGFREWRRIRTQRRAAPALVEQAPGARS